MTAVPAAGEPHRRADAARNHQRLIEAAAEVFAARGLDATLDDIASHAGVNVATAYRHFANKHELAREFLAHCVDQAVAIAEQAAAEPDPWQGLTQFLARSLELIASNHALVDVLSRAYGPEQFAELIRRINVPLERLVARSQQTGLMRADVGATDFGPMLEMLSAVNVLGVPDLAHRYTALILAGLRPSQDALPGQPPAEELMLQLTVTKGR
jgi:AcrR family transcriptional regulator